MYRLGVVGGLDPSAGAGVEMDVKVASAVGVYAHPVATMVTYQTPSTYLGGTCLELESVRKQLETLTGLRYWKFGALCNEGVVDLLLELTSGTRVVDPVLKASAGGELFSGPPKKYLELLRESFAATPNVPEAEALLGRKIDDVEDMVEAAKELASLGPRLVVLTGGHLGGEELVDVIYYDGKVELVRGKKYAENAHGSGTFLAAALASYLAKGTRPLSAARIAIGFARLAHRFSLKVDDGLVLDPFVQLRYMAIKSEMFEEYKAFLEWLEGLSYVQAVKIAPEVGINVAYSTPAEMVRGKGSILGVPGRLHLTPKGLKRCCEPWWGAAGHTARLLLEAQKYEPKYRAAMNVRYSEENVKKLKEAGYEVVEVKREEQPRGVKTMQWVVRNVYERLGRVPPVIYDKGFYGKEAMIRLLARDLCSLKEMLNVLVLDL